MREQLFNWSVDALIFPNKNFLVAVVITFLQKNLCFKVMLLAEFKKNL